MKTDSNAMVWSGRVVSAIPVIMMGVLPVFFMTMKQDVIMESMKKYGYPNQYAFGIFCLEVAFAWIYAIPQTAFIGAILLTAYLGGAVATHVRASELPNAVGPILFAGLAWLGLFLRDERLRSFLRSRA